jgi:1-deoxy-D-xylulose-5-phosphate reductoisomerase
MVRKEVTPGERLGLAVLGSTGSIGRQALEVARLHRDRLRVVALVARSNADLLEEQAREFLPLMVGLVEEGPASRLRERLNGTGIEVRAGAGCLVEAAAHPLAEVVLNAVVGSAGLPATLAALGAGKKLALANKESLVAGGDLVLQALSGGGELIPVDSEHSAVFHCLSGEDPGSVERIILTASGGPFRGYTRGELEGVTPEMALKHPTWSMGPRITVDSATLMNKGLEVIEAHYLFGLPYDRIEVVVHPQSIVHSLVEFRDGSLAAQLSVPDMRIPIGLALSHPERWRTPARRTTLEDLRELTFEPVDRGTFRCLDLAYRAGKMGGTATAVLNAADEVAVELFLRGEIGFLDIERMVEAVLEDHRPWRVETLDDVVAAEEWARSRALKWRKEKHG